MNATLDFSRSSVKADAKRFAKRAQSNPQSRIKEPGESYPPGSVIEPTLSYPWSASVDPTSLLAAKESLKTRLLEVMVSSQSITDALVLHYNERDTICQ